MGDLGEAVRESRNGTNLASDPDASPRVVAEPRRLLLVEDDIALRAHLAELMMQEGYYVGCAADGAEALRRLQVEPLPAAILLDIMLPRVNGVVFREAQLRSPGLRGIPTVAITSMKDLVDLDSLEFAAVFKKPIDFESLVETLDDLCPKPERG
jgi:two-component system, chemotaxis family, chemotaxis protein CheY